MSITTALYSSFYGLRNTEQRINVTSQNVTNADRPGYTRKELHSNYQTTNAGTVPTTTTIATVNYSDFLLEAVVDDNAVYNMQNIIAEYLTYYSNEMGSIDGDNSLSSYMDSFAAGLDQLTQSPEDASLKAQVVSFAERIADELNRLSASVQDYRLKADQEIERVVRQVNQLTSTIELLNKEVIAAESLGKSSADLVDQRNQAVEDLSQYISFDYFVNSNNYMQIYTGGRPLLDSRAHTIDYTANTALSKTTLYPAGFPAIDMDGFDLTPYIKGGELAGLIQTRDTYMVEEQAKLDEFAAGLITQMNTLLNQGASMPPRDTMTGDLTGLTAATAIAGTGIVRIAVVDANGVVVNFADLNLAGYATVNAMITGINTALGPDLTASLTATGELSLVANNSGEGIAINQMTSSFPTTETFSDYFGLNNMFDGTGADDIAVSAYLTANGHFLATGYMDNNPALLVGDVGVNPGDSSLSVQMRTALRTPYSFSLAGNFAAQSETLDNYIDRIISDLAYRTKNAQSNADVSQSLKDQTLTTLQNLYGVNIDEEMTHLIDLQAKYEASATMIATLQELYDALLSAVR